MELKKQYLKGKNECKVTFKIEKDLVNGAKSAALVGSFNGWDVNATPMKIAKTGEASVTINLETENEYQYKIVLDGINWINDPAADKTTGNEFGELNSVVIL